MNLLVIFYFRSIEEEIVVPQQKNTDESKIIETETFEKGYVNELKFCMNY